MQITHLEYFLDQISRVPSLQDASVFRNDGGKWSFHNSDVPVDAQLLNALKALKGPNSVRKLLNPSRALIRLSKGEVGVVLPVPPKTHTKTLKQHASRLEECFSAATSSFHAHHDELTGILNRHGIRAELSRSITALFQQAPSAEKLEQQFLGNGELVLFAFDIDRFKSVNDTYGHEAGDIVLSVFADRVNRMAEDLSNKYSAKFIFGRPGGEEFELIAVGTLALKEVIEIGDLLLNRIRQPNLPSPKEIENQLSKRNRAPLGDLSRYPNRVTASIGVSRRRISSSTINIEALHSTLRNEADAALYRAKADGRNCVRIHEEIRRKHGKVFSFHDSSCLVTIDIGANVGVEKGQTYSVFYPPFTGGEKIQHGENSSKVLGEFPQIPSAELSVVGVQRETSTCVVLKKVNKDAIPVGSRLKYIFKGSDVPLISRSGLYHALAEPLSALPEYIKRNLDDDRLGTVLAMSGSFSGEDDRPLTIAADELLSSLHLLLPPGTKLFSGIGSGLFAVMLQTSDDETPPLQQTLERVIERAKKLRFSMKVGACTLASLPAAAEVSPRSIIFYARAALQQTSIEENDVIIFDENSPASLIYSWRRGAESENGIRDYERLREFGFSSAYLNNQIGVLIMENDLREYFFFAEAAFAAAYEENSQPVFRANLAMLRAEQGKFLEAFGDFENVKEYVESEKETYLLAYARSALQVAREGKLNGGEIVDLLLEVTTDFPHALTDGYSQTWLKDIRVALKAGEFG